MSVRPPVLIVPTGVANLASVRAGLRRAGADPRVEQDADAVASAEFVVLPGVGAFGAGMAELIGSELDGAVRARVEEDRPLLAVCLGMHLLCGSSEESPGVAGVGLVSQSVEHFPDAVRAPQFGWNRIEPGSGCRFLRSGYAYFANSYRLKVAPDGWRVAMADHGGPFVAAMERGAVLACQFHPELSGELGVGLMSRWLGGAEC